MIPTAAEMARAVMSITEKLIEAEILDPVSRSASYALSRQLRISRDSRSWTISVPREQPFTFEAWEDDRGEIYAPTVSVDGIVTNDSGGESLFSKVDISLLVAPLGDGAPIRWHFDMANRATTGAYQAGPLFHMQYGGHVPGSRHLDFPLKVPRWAHAPMDLILLLEAVAANFFTERWQSELREDPGWCDYVSQSERLCLAQYTRNISSYVDKRTCTVLGSLWAAKSL